MLHSRFTWAGSRVNNITSKETFYFFSVYSLKGHCVKAVKLNSQGYNFGRSRAVPLSIQFYHPLSRDFKCILPISLSVNKENYRTPSIVDT